MQQNPKKSKSKKAKTYIEYGFLILFVALLFTTDLKAEVFGFVQRGFLKLGFFQPDIEQVDQVSTVSDEYEKHPLKLRDQDGNVLNVAQLEGKVVFINFWATWCPPCVAEMPSINALYQDYKTDKDVVFLMVSMDRSFAKAEQFLEDKKFDFAIQEPLSAVPQEFQARGIPNTLVLDTNGKIVFSHVGMGNYNTAEFKTFLNDLKKK